MSGQKYQFKRDTRDRDRIIIDDPNKQTSLVLWEGLRPITLNLSNSETDPLEQSNIAEVEKLFIRKQTIFRSRLDGTPVSITGNNSIEGFLVEACKDINGCWLDTKRGEEQFIVDLPGIKDYQSFNMSQKHGLLLCLTRSNDLLCLDIRQLVLSLDSSPKLEYDQYFIKIMSDIDHFDRKLPDSVALTDGTTGMSFIEQFYSFDRRYLGIYASDLEAVPNDLTISKCKIEVLETFTSISRDLKINLCHITPRYISGDVETAFPYLLDFHKDLALSLTPRNVLYYRDEIILEGVSAFTAFTQKEFGRVVIDNIDSYRNAPVMAVIVYRDLEGGVYYVAMGPEGQIHLEKPLTNLYGAVLVPDLRFNRTKSARRN